MNRWLSARLQLLQSYAKPSIYKCIFTFLYFDNDFTEIFSWLINWQVFIGLGNLSGENPFITWTCDACCTLIDICNHVLSLLLIYIYVYIYICLQIDICHNEWLIFFIVGSDNGMPLFRTHSLLWVGIPFFRDHGMVSNMLSGFGTAD